MSLRRLHELTTRLAAAGLTLALALPLQGPWSAAQLLLAGVTLFFAHNTCNALFGRAVLFPIRVNPDDRENYGLARVFSAGYSIVLWLMLVLGARWYGMG
jgi:hypothetical protein